MRWITKRLECWHKGHVWAATGEVRRAITSPNWSMSRPWEYGRKCCRCGLFAWSSIKPDEAVR